MVDTTNLMGYPFVGLCAFNIPYIVGGTGVVEYCDSPKIVTPPVIIS